VINNCQALDHGSKALGLSKDLQEGVLFLTYSTLISQVGAGGEAGRQAGGRLVPPLLLLLLLLLGACCGPSFQPVARLLHRWRPDAARCGRRPAQVKGRSRLQQVSEWLGGPSFDGCLLFDECHKAKHFVPGKEAQSTKVGAGAPARCPPPPPFLHPPLPPPGPAQGPAQAAWLCPAACGAEPRRPPPAAPAQLRGLHAAQAIPSRPASRLHRQHDGRSAGDVPGGPLSVGVRRRPC
jgi:hypothetical protein